MVNFTNPYPSSTDLTNFMSQYNLTLHAAPLSTLPVTTGCSYTYIFEAQVPLNTSGVPDFNYFVQLMQEMYTNSNGTICAAGPNFVNHMPIKDNQNGDSSAPPESPVYTLCEADEPNDPFIDYQWYIYNDGFNELDFNSNLCTSGGTAPIDGTIGADAKICDCWKAGLSGLNIKIGILAQGDIVTSHNDLTNQPFANMFDCSGINHPCNTLNPSTGQTGIGMHMAGIIAATKNNNIGIAGLAENSIITPYKIGDDFTSDADLISALQLALVQQEDILAINYFSPIESPNIKIELWNHHISGRQFVHGAKGTIIIAPAGHTETASTGTWYPSHPAKYNLDAFDKTPEVIGVINSNRYDLLEPGEETPCLPTYNIGGTNYAHPSNYGSGYDIAAPASQFFSTEGNSQINRGEIFSSAVKQSADAVAVTTGVAALLLENNLTESDVQFRDRLRGGADKVSYVYNNINGYSSLEFAFGRINCEKSKDYTPTSINEITQSNLSASVFNTKISWEISLTEILASTFNCEVYNNLGQLVYKNEFLKAEKKISIPNINFAKGVYLIKIIAGKSSCTLKAIK